MNSSQFKKNELKYLASILLCAPQEIVDLCENLDKYYSKWNEVKINKETGEIKTYLDGTPKQRIIRASYRRLKYIQRSIKTNILPKIHLPDNVYGGVKGKSNITNALKHKGNKYVFTTDLKSFFPSITHKQIFDLFLKIGYSNHLAHWLTKLTSREFELPQGTPTSTLIANIIFLKHDYKLIEFCKANGINYTRYVDDLTFSSQKDFREHIKSLLHIIKDSGFKVNYRKTKYEGNQNITGLAVFNIMWMRQKK